MSDDRLLHSRDADALDLELLDAGAAEHPAPHAKSRTLAALGLGVPHVAQADVGVAASGSVGGAAGHAGARQLFIGLGVALLIVAATGWRVLDMAHRHASPAVPGDVAPVAPSPPREPPPREAPPPKAQPIATAASAVPTLESAAPVHAAAPHPQVSAPADDDTLGAEVAALDRAREALGNGDAPGALRVLDAYQQSFPHGTLAQEAVVLRIESLVRAGNTSAARRVADRFLAASPGSPHAARIRHMLDAP